MARSMPLTSGITLHRRVDAVVGEQVTGHVFDLLRVLVAAAAKDPDIAARVPQARRNAPP